MRASSYASISLLALSLVVAACGGDQGAFSGSSFPPGATGGAAANAPDAMLRAPGPMTPDRASGGGAGTRP
jgi:hypothetical protein